MEESNILRNQTAQINNFRRPAGNNPFKNIKKNPIQVSKNDQENTILSSPKNRKSKSK